MRWFIVWRKILYAYSFGVFGVLCLLLTPFAFPLALLPKGLRKPFQKVIRRITYMGFGFVRWHCHITGFASMRFIDHSGGRSSRLLVANHLSMFDIVLLFSFLPHVQTLVHAKFASNPLLWAIIRTCGYIPIQPTSSAEGVQAYQLLRESLLENHTLVLFPEGTRSEDGRLGPMKKGPFRLAAELQIPISPVFFTCTQPFLNRRAFVPREPGPVVLEAHVYPPLEPLEGRPLDAAEMRLAFEKAYADFICSDQVLAWNRSLV